MTHSFNLIDEPFVPCLFPDGSRVELCLRDVLVRAHELREIHDDSPIVMITLHRLLLAILHRNFGPKDMGQWRTIWEAGRFDTDILNQYFDKWHERFDLFHPKWPFYQTARLVTEKQTPALLFEELSSGNNATLFDHTCEGRHSGVAPAAAARGVIARQGYALAGTPSSQTITIADRPVKITTSRMRGPLAKSLLLLAQGESLFKTLMLNLQRPEQSDPDEDIPIWERGSSEDIIQLSRTAGFVDLYTLQCRRLRLETLGDDGLVHGVHFAQGRVLADDELDPMKAYNRDEKKGWVAMEPRESRALWRDSGALFELAQQRRDSHRPPSALAWIAEAVAADLVPRSAMYKLMVAGVASDRASVLLWRQEQLPLSVRYLHNADLLSNLQTVISAAESVGRALREAVWQCVKQFLHPAKTDNLLRLQKLEISAMVESLASQRHYWPCLETPFLNLLRTLPAPADASTEEDQAHRHAQLAHWFHHVLRPTACQAYDTTAGRMDNTARALRAMVIGRRKLERELGKIASQPPFDHSPGQPAPDTEETAHVTIQS